VINFSDLTVREAVSVGGEAKVPDVYVWGAVTGEGNVIF